MDLKKIMDRSDRACIREKAAVQLSHTLRNVRTTYKHHCYCRNGHHHVRRQFSPDITQVRQSRILSFFSIGCKLTKSVNRLLTCPASYTCRIQRVHRSQLSTILQCFVVLKNQKRCHDLAAKETEKNCDRNLYIGTEETEHTTKSNASISKRMGTTTSLATKEQNGL